MDKPTGRQGFVCMQDAYTSRTKTMNEIASTGVLLCPDCGSYGSKVDISEDKYIHSCKCGYSVEGSISNNPVRENIQDIGKYAITLRPLHSLFKS